VFERFTEETRRCVASAHDEARALGHAELAPAHLLLGVARAHAELVGCACDVLREAVVTARGAGAPLEGLGADAVPLTATAKVVLVTAAQDAVRDDAGPHDLLLALAQVAPAELRRLGLDPRGARERALAVRAHRGARPSTLPELQDSGDPVEVRLGAHLVGDLGHPRVDARVVAAVLARGGPLAAVLRERGIDDALLAAHLDGEG
jgi:ATP-dependent Clp protease ATP-binding subunit ClpA